MMLICFILQFYLLQHVTGFHRSHHIWLLPYSQSFMEITHFQIGYKIQMCQNFEKIKKYILKKQKCRSDFRNKFIDPLSADVFKFEMEMES